MNILIEEVQYIRSNTVAQNSRAIYVNSNVKFLIWINDHKRHLLTDDFIEYLDNNQARPSTIKAFLSQNEIHPIKFDEITAVDFMTWIVSIRMRNGNKPGYSSYNSHRSAFYNLFRHYDQIMNHRLASDIAVHFKGLKRTTVQSISNGQGNIKVGKDPLSFGLYRFLAKSFLEQSSKEYIFGHCFMIMCWNLMCRSANAFTIKYDHLEWNEDSLCVYFAHMKNDPTGERPRDPRHVYANPLMPEICPILSLGLYWLTYSFTIGNSSLYPGNNQYDRFRKILQRSSGIASVSEELNRRSIDPKDLGTHSMRKGAATYCSSGSTAGPSSSAIHLRAGWALGGVQDTYIRYEAAGDMYVGRVVSGLPIDKPEFDMVCPRFPRSDSDDVVETVKKIFKNIPANLIAIGEKVLASLVFHSEFLLSTLPRNHPVLQNQLFRDASLLSSLKSRVICDDGNTRDLPSTGIPPHTNILREMKTMISEMKLIRPKIDESVEKTVDGIIGVLEDRAISAGTVTRDGLQQLLSQELQKFLGSRGNSETEEPAAEDSNRVQENLMFQWGGHLRRLPEDYSLPTGTVDSAFKNWMLPDTINSICALRYCSTSDFSDGNKKRRFGDLCRLMRDIERVAKEMRIFENRPSISQVNEMIAAWEEDVAIASQTPSGRTRRVGQLKWTSILKILRNRD